MINRTSIAVTVATLATAGAASADIFTFSDSSGLSAEAEFVLVDATTLAVRLTNTSTGLPDGFDNADQLLTAISWDFGDGTRITGGSVIIGDDSETVNFDTYRGEGENVSGEWGYGNGGTTNMHDNFISAMRAGTEARFGSENLDGPTNLNGPQGGILAGDFLMDLGGLGAIQNQILAQVTLSQAISDLSFLHNGLITVEYGSDAAFLTVPAPASLALLGVAGLMMPMRRRRDTA